MLMLMLDLIHYLIRIHSACYRFPEERQYGAMSYLRYSLSATVKQRKWIWPSPGLGKPKRIIVREKASRIRGEADPGQSTKQAVLFIMIVRG